MENFPTEWDLKNLVKALSEGRELATQLQVHLSEQSSYNSYETREFLLHRILHSYDQALAVLKNGRSGVGTDGGEALPPGVAAVGTSESPRSLVGSPQSDYSDQDQASRKRKAVPRTRKVIVNTRIEGQLDDGYNWRKYGQKDILGAKYPRGYYRCTHRYGQDCLATKQVQKSDEDPNIFEITYRRNHTCNTPTNPNYPPIPDLDPQNEAPNPLPGPGPGPEQTQPLFNTQTSLRVITQGLDSNYESPQFDPCNFPSSARTSNPENNDNFSGLVPNLGDYSSYYDIFNDNYEGLVANLHINSESELSPIVAAVTSSSNSPTVDTSLPFGSSIFGPDFGFGKSRHYP